MKKCLSKTFLEELEIEGEVTDEKITERNIEVLKEILTRDLILHCWCDGDGRRDVLIYVSNKYMWILNVFQDELYVIKIPVDFFYVPNIDEKKEFSFPKDSKEYKLVENYLKKFH